MWRAMFDGRILPKPRSIVVNLAGDVPSARR
jgi:hypothetical protein